MPKPDRDDVREAVEKRLREDPAFAERVRKSLKRNERVLELLRLTSIVDATHAEEER